MRYFIVDAFTDQLFGGNPAGVVLLESERFPEEKLMLQIAAELRYSETAFIRRHSDKEFTIRYFTPKAEVELCGHATIASFHLLHHEGLVAGQSLCYTLAGDLRIEAVSFHVFAFANDGYMAHVRNFAPLYDIPEESATGTANAALTYYLQQNGCLGAEAECAFLQGEAMGRPSVVATRIQKDGTLFVGGTAAVVAHGELFP